MDDKNQKAFSGPAVDANTKSSWPKEYGVTSPADNVLNNLFSAQKEYNKNSLCRINATVRDNVEQNKNKAFGWLNTRITQLKDDIADLKEQLGLSRTAKSQEGSLLALPVVNQDGIQVTEDKLAVDPNIKNPGAPDIEGLDNEDAWRNKVDVGLTLGPKSPAKSRTNQTLLSPQPLSPPPQHQPTCLTCVQAPQIVGWVQTLLPRLPKPKDGIRTTTGLFN
ncbi:hypothetical protein FDECE_6154 [Fusarium decemcellulare]|nr:hypothetical protein FDECE_6154 [Fusarium decemcellulare]